MANTGTIQANGQTLYYEIHGDGDPLVLVMGIGYDSTLWTLHQVPALAQHFQVILLDNRDVGRSGKASRAYTISDMADDVAGLLDALAIQRAHLLGLSMGALIGQEFALRHPGRLKRLVLCGPDAAPARDVVHPISVWRWVKESDSNGSTFGAVHVAVLLDVPSQRGSCAADGRFPLEQSQPGVARRIRAAGAGVRAV
jgi:pimeloyl-ACP methyl ester carboxylesterase